LLPFSIAIKVSLEPEAIELLRRYRIALNYAINKILGLNLKTTKEVHRELYRELREWFGLPSRIAVDCYREPLQMQRLRGGTLIRVGGLPRCCTRDQD